MKKIHISPSLRINKAFVSNLWGNFGVLSIIIAFYFYLFAEATLSIYNVRLIFLFISYVCFIFGVFVSSKFRIDSLLFTYYGVSIFIFLFSSPLWQDKFDINIYLSTVTAILIINYYDLFIKYMRYFIILTVLLGAYEFLFKEYLFVVYRETYFGFRALDEKLFSGSTNVFRAKVFFEGPLALSQFAIGAAFLFRKHIKVLFLILLISIFANGRLGIIICAGIIALYYVKKYNLLTILLKPKYFFLLIFGLLFSFTVIYLLLDESSIERFKNSFDTSNEGNAARITFWINGIKTWLSYDLAHLIFGNNGYYGSIYKNNAENGWITLLVNNGIIGFLYYFIPVLLLSINYLIKASVNFWYIFLLFFCMFVQTFHLGASANLFYWLIIFSFLNTTYDNKISL